MMKKILATLMLAPIASISMFSHAATSDGKTASVSAGWMHIMPQGKKQGVNGSVIQTESISPNGGFEIDTADTAAILFDYYVNDNVSLELVAGVPPKMKIDGKGKILENIGGIDLGQVGKVGEVDAYTPAFLVKYQFGAIENKFRPFVGAGVMYAHFSNFELENGVNGKLTSALTSVNPALAGLAGNLSIQDVKIHDAFAPVVTVGADFNFNKSWFATASVSYAHLETEASLKINGDSAIAASMNPVVTGKSKIEINPLVTLIGVGYRF